ncbi:response regulator [Zavarzinia sp. CC-PAN008]|uniref:response regulator n=1 Tax=Zavarzinia sp. CC-PAN008 TaxID=3243332 RepID=UPI003F748809
MRILYIDDDPVLSRLVQKTLGREGFSVSLCHSPQEGLSAIGEGRFDAIALDHYMPGQDGLETLEAIQKLDRPPPVVYVTGSSESRLAVAALKAGATDYVTKDVQGEFMSLLGAALRSAIDQVRLRQERERAVQDLAQALERAERLAADREMLLREVTHRVANSLQVIASILQLQASGADDSARKVLLEARDRVFAVAAVHRRLYDSEDGMSVPVSVYLDGLVDEIRRSHGDPDISIRADGPTVDIGADRAVALGIIVTELLLNALKYAYPDGQGPIRITFRHAGEEGEVAVEDDGVGLSGSGVKGSGLGMRIVSGMASTLRGSVQHDQQHSHGTRHVIRFPVDAPERRVA